VGFLAKQSGLGWTTLALDDSGGTARSIINDVSNLQFSTPRAVQDVTGMDKLAIERLLLLADFSGTLSMPALDTAATVGSHTVCKTIPSSTVNRTLTLVIASQTLANETLCTDYAGTRGTDGSFTFSVPFVLADGTVPTWA
jgi:hypothetical protein